MQREIPSTHQKALQVNLDPAKYGTFAEIGAGQEVARWFFHVGGAAGTIAKTISAYDMIISDAIYGHAERYVSRQRLETMLDHEYSLLLERLTKTSGSDKPLFCLCRHRGGAQLLAARRRPRLAGPPLPDRAGAGPLSDHHACPAVGQRESG